MKKNVITCCDSYKLSHFLMYPEGTEYVYSYFEARNGAVFPYTVFFGLQYLIKELLEGEVVTKTKIEEAAALVKSHMGSERFFNRKMWEYILSKHGGRLPVEIRAVPEGTLVPNSNILMSVQNTDPLCAPLTNHLETYLTHVWSSSTVATMGAFLKEKFKFFLGFTSDNATCDFMLHDFGFRGVSSFESAAIEGCAHLLNFKGTDTIAAIETARDYYSGDINNLAWSVPATEHSVMTSKGRDGEKSIVESMIKTFPSGILSVVADSYDIENFVKVIMKDLKKSITDRDGVFVVRPDSVRGKNDTPERQMADISKWLREIFGGTTNSRGFTVLNPKVRVIWGDGINADGIVKILRETSNAGFSSENYVFGMGGGLLQKINRDTQRFAFKCSSQFRDGSWIDIFKDPLDKSKSSKKGRLKLLKDGDSYKTVGINEHSGEDCLKTVFRDGYLIKEYSFDECRKNLILPIL